MKTLHCKLVKETYEEQSAAGRYNPATVALWRGHRCTIGAGESDSVYLFEDHGYLFVVFVNPRLDYCGLEVFDDNGDEVGNAFCQGQEQYEEMLGKRGLQLSAHNIARRLAEYAIQ